MRGFVPQSWTLWLWALGCSELVLVHPPDARPNDASNDAARGDADAGTGADAGADTGVEAGVCDQTSRCQDCESCAVLSKCFSAVSACGDDACRRLASCVRACAAGETGNACRRSCGERDPDARARVLALFDCSFCQECPIDCAEGAATWCAGNPFFE
ncbi:MAG: hypothetical protein AAGE52_20990 [Myxococcota bacterium]